MALLNQLPKFTGYVLSRDLLGIIVKSISTWRECPDLMPAWFRCAIFLLVLHALRSLSVMFLMWQHQAHWNHRYVVHEDIRLGFTLFDASPHGLVLHSEPFCSGLDSFILKKRLLEVFVQLNESRAYIYSEDGTPAANGCHWSIQYLENSEHIGKLVLMNKQKSSWTLTNVRNPNPKHGREF